MNSPKASPAFAKRLNEAIQLFRDGKTKEAAKLLEGLNGEFPDQAPILWYLGGFYHDLGKLKEAIPHCRRATELAPKSERASLGLFHALWENDQLDDALEELKRFQLLTNWSCKDYVIIMAEITEKWRDDAPVSPKASKKK